MEGKGKHNLGSIIFVGLWGVLSGCESGSDIEEVPEKATIWLWHYNNERPHMVTGGIAPYQKRVLA